MSARTDASPSHLALLLDGPLQSWGYGSRFDRRTTLPFPTRSGITGMICAAMGIGRTDTDALAGFSEVRMTTLTFSQTGRLTDFHTVGGGYDPKTQRHQMPRKANNATPGVVVSRREYLLGSRFGVILSGPAERLTAMAEALRNPRWGIWLGRKSCIPATPVCQGIFDGFEAAASRLKTAVEEITGTPPRQGGRSVIEVERFAEGDDTIMDLPLDFANRRFAPRRVKIDTPNPE